MAEHPTVNRTVAGSSPAAGANIRALFYIYSTPVLLVSFHRGASVSSRELIRCCLMALWVLLCVFFGSRLSGVCF